MSDEKSSGDETRQLVGNQSPRERYFSASSSVSEMDAFTSQFPQFKKLLNNLNSHVDKDNKELRKVVRLGEILSDQLSQVLLDQRSWNYWPNSYITPDESEIALLFANQCLKNPPKAVKKCANYLKRVDGQPSQYGKNIGKLLMIIGVVCLLTTPASIPLFIAHTIWAVPTVAFLVIGFLGAFSTGYICYKEGKDGTGIFRDLNRFRNAVQDNNVAVKNALQSSQTLFKNTPSETSENFVENLENVDQDRTIENSFSTVSL